MQIGIVKWFDLEKGFGVIGTPEGEEYFLHLNSFTTNPQQIQKGTPLIFTSKLDKVKNRKAASKIRMICKSEDWKMILSYIGKPDIIQIESHKKIQSFSLIKTSLYYFFKEKKEEEIQNFIIDYFDNELDSKNFVLYSELIENCISKCFSNDISVNLLKNVFSHFGENLDVEIVFNVWKHKKFKYISRNEEECEIPESILKSYINEIDINELTRILEFSYCSEFNSYYVNNKFSNLENLTSSEIKKLYKYIEFEKETERENRKQQLDNLYIQKIEEELIEKALNLDLIKNSSDLNSFNDLIELIPSDFSDIDKIKITETINQIIAEKCSNEYKAELWFEGIIKEISFETLSNYFFDNVNKKEKQVSILMKLEIGNQLDLLKQYSSEYSFEKSFELLGEFLKKENSLNYSFDFSKVLFDSEFWKDKKGGELIELFSNYVHTQSNDEQKYELFLKGYVKNVPHIIVRQKIHKLNNNDCKRIFNNISDDEPFIKDILTEKATDSNTDSLSWLYDLAIEFLDPENFKSFDKQVFEQIKISDYFSLWENGKSKIFPLDYISNLLNDNFENYTQVKSWIFNKAITTDEISKFLFSYLYKQEKISNRIVFFKQVNHIKALLQLKETNLERLIQIQNDFYNLILWTLDKEIILDFEILKKYYIYFNPDEQVRIFRKLFFLEASNKFDLTIEKLNELARFDLDLYNINLEFNPDIAVDISTDVVIKVLTSFYQNNRFFLESELLKVVLNDFVHNKTKRFKLSNYFENCLGRLTDDYNWKTNGEISKIKYGENNFYYAITFDYDPYLVEALKVFKKRDFHREGNKYFGLKHWEIPSQYEAEVLIFTKENRFFLNFEGCNFANNTHLAKFKRVAIPNGITYCEGRLADKPHYTFKSEFWWCGGQPCFGKCETIHTKEEWENYTLLDFCEILGLNTDEINSHSQLIPKGYYYQFIGIVNRFNRLLDRLYCVDCNHILYPVETDNFAAYNIIKFICKNNECKNKNVIYLNHCLNCNCIIDSRVSKKCNNDWHICHNCGSCCSHSKFEKRLSDLRLNGGKIYPRLLNYVEKKLGHLERGEYFCYKCETAMTEKSKDIFQCLKCHVRYDTTKYNFNRPHQHLKKE